jgi:hypothetical protein
MGGNRFSHDCKDLIRAALWFVYRGTPLYPQAASERSIVVHCCLVQRHQPLSVKINFSTGCS